MTDMILDADQEILKMLKFDTVSDRVVLHIQGKSPGLYLVTPIEQLDEVLTTCPPEHRDALLDARNYLYKKDIKDVDSSSTSS